VEERSISRPDLLRIAVVVVRSREFFDVIVANKRSLGQFILHGIAGQVDG
jgi:hypothetical protein